jgi:hypothetical protein
VEASLFLGDRRWRLRDGNALTIGRGRVCDLRLPEDEHLSRLAATVRTVDDFLLIRNESHTKPLVLRPPIGEDRVVEPGAATTSLPFERFSIVFAAEGGAPIEVRVALPTAPVAPALGPVDAAAKQTLTAPFELTPAQRRVMAALCEPLLTRSGAGARPATYAQIGARLGRQPHYVRNVLKALRERLTGLGVPGLAPEAAPGTEPDDFRWALARYALRGGWIDPADVHALCAGGAGERRDD